MKGKHTTALLSIVDGLAFFTKGRTKMRQKEIILRLMQQGLLIAPELAFSEDNKELLDFALKLSEKHPEKIASLVLSQESLKRLKEEETKEGKEKETSPEKEGKKGNKGINIIFSYNKSSETRDIQDFVSYFNSRFKLISSILANRPELSSPVSISRLVSKQDRENVALIGIVKEKNVFNNGNIMLVLEDSSGEIKVMVTQTSQEAYEAAKTLVLDEVVGVTGMSGNKIVFASNIFLPDIPNTKEFKKAPDEAYAVFLSDIHVGSNNFLEDKFIKFLKWLNGEIGTEEHKRIVKKIKYMFIAGDLVDGIGIYPGQESELEIKDIYKQFEKCAELLSKVPSYITIIACPGNHDPVRLSEPQPVISEEYAAPLYRLPNFIMLSNPAIVNIHSSESFPGFDVLLYHGYSFDYYVANVDDIRLNGGYDRADLIMRFLLQRRHLAPSHSSTLYIPDNERDNLVISKIPDFFVTGHIHKTSVSSYRNVSVICGSCWQSKTSFQEKVGHNPEPARVPIVNLQTRDTKILKF